MGDDGLTLVAALLALVILGSVVWVLIDAPAHGLSRWWAFGVFAVWLVVFPAYLVTRSNQRAGTRRRPALPPGWYRDSGGAQRWWENGWTERTR